MLHFRGEAAGPQEQRLATGTKPSTLEQSTQQSATSRVVLSIQSLQLPILMLDWTTSFFSDVFIINSPGIIVK